MIDERGKTIDDIVHLKETLTFRRVGDKALRDDIGDGAGILHAMQVAAQLFRDRLAFTAEAGAEIDEI